MWHNLKHIVETQQVIPFAENIEQINILQEYCLTNKRITKILYFVDHRGLLNLLIAPQ